MEPSFAASDKSFAASDKSLAETESSLAKTDKSFADSDWPCATTDASLAAVANSFSVIVPSFAITAKSSALIAPTLAASANTFAASESVLAATANVFSASISVNLVSADNLRFAIELISSPANPTFTSISSKISLAFKSTTAGFLIDRYLTLGKYTVFKMFSISLDPESSPKLASTTNLDWIIPSWFVKLTQNPLNVSPLE